MLVLECLAFYSMVCVIIASIVVYKGLDELKSQVPEGMKYIDFILMLLLAILISPGWMPVVIVRFIRKAWREITDQCQ